MENETNQNLSQEAPQKTDRQLLEEIHSFSRKTKNYMMWQLIITVALVVLPLLAALFLVPYTLKTLGSAYGLDSLTGGSANSININPSSAADIVNQLKELQQ